MNYGKGLKIVRSLAGLQQKQLAKIAGIDASHVSLIERGKRDPSTKTLKKLSVALNVPEHLLALLSADREEWSGVDPKAFEQILGTLLKLVLRNERRRKPRRRTRRD
jgi:transcriptional regulator with XRE-family HTH domain